jgi:DNA invertase Pin-like site-specific DNA recombinase
MTDGPDTRVIGYARVSTEEQAASGYGLAAQEEAIRREAERRGWNLVGIVRDEGATGKSLDRPGLHAALTRAASGEANAVVVAKLDRATRSLVGLADLIEWTTDAGIGLVALDLGIDTTTSTGRLVAHVMGSVAQWEREQIASRTRDAATARRKQGKRMGLAGVRDTNPEVAERIARERGTGATWQRIADDLNADGIPTVRGGIAWRVSSVQAAAGYVRPPAKVKRGGLPAVPKRRKSAS